MKKLIICLILGFATSYVSAQKNGSAKGSNNSHGSLTEHIAKYNFADAESILKNKVNATQRSGQDASSLETQLRAIQRAKSKLNVVERVSFIDSLIVPKTDFLKYIPLSKETGNIDFCSHYFQRSDSLGCTMFLSQMGDYMMYAAPNETGHPILFSSVLLGKDWSAPTCVMEMGLSEHDDTDQNYPFVMSDGTTLYYAAKGEETMGGYDIFMTRYDNETHSFLAPENIGMPFNSPANDYLYAVDEFNNLGWFVTDRNSPSDSVCVYTFIPNQSRTIYNPEDMSGNMLRSLARIDRIADTWRDSTLVVESLARLQAARQQAAESIQASQQHTNSSALNFVVNDQKVYKSIQDFKNQNAQLKATYWAESQIDLSKAESEIEILRSQFAKASNETRQSLANKILTEEARINKLRTNIKLLENEIRNLELNAQQ